MEETTGRAFYENSQHVQTKRDINLNVPIVNERSTVHDILKRLKNQVQSACRLADLVHAGRLGRRLVTVLQDRRMRDSCNPNDLASIYNSVRMVIDRISEVLGAPQSI